jgi:hypothetical protein
VPATVLGSSPVLKGFLMGTDSLTMEQIARSQAAENESLRAELARLKAHVGLVDEQPKADGYPKVVYRAQDDLKAGQIDHPGWDVKLVGDPAAYDRAVADGWQPAPGAYVYPEIEEQVAVVRKVTKAKK